MMGALGNALKKKIAEKKEDSSFVKGDDLKITNDLLSQLEHR